MQPCIDTPKYFLCLYRYVTIKPKYEEFSFKAKKNNAETRVYSFLRVVYLFHPAGGRCHKTSENGKSSFEHMFALLEGGVLSLGM